MSTVRELYQLQLMDSERDERNHRLAEVEGGLGEMGNVFRAREAVSETEHILAKQKGQLRNLDLEIAGLESRLKQNQERLYGGTVRNPKELSSLQEEAAVLRRHRSELEDGQLELLISVEEQEAELAERRARQQQIETTWGDEQRILLAEKGQLEARLAELEELVAQKRARLSATDRALYDDLRDQLGGKGVVLLKRGICQACGVDVPTGMAHAVERGEGQHFCPTCNRLLFAGAQDKEHMV
jgi:uncharacterized protein